jgi:hypothetical protein
VFYRCEQRVEEYAKVASVGVMTQGLEELDAADSTSEQKVRLNTDKKTKYEADQATAFSLLFRSLTEDDQAVADEHEKVYDLWAYLKRKYSQVDEITAQMYMTKIQTFMFDEHIGIVASWDKLKGYRRRLVTVNSRLKSTYEDETLLLILIQSLPETYESVIDSLDMQDNLSIDKKLKYLEEKELRLQRGREERAHVVSNKGKRSKTHHRHNSESSSDEQKRGFLCYNCQGKHKVKDCPYLEIAQIAVERARRKSRNLV